jgi:hypothetical protein
MTTFALADFVLEMIIHDRGRYALHPRAGYGFAVALDALFADPRLDPETEIDAVIRLGRLFEEKRAHEVADRIVAYLSRDERARRAMRCLQ